MTLIKCHVQVEKVISQSNRTIAWKHMEREWQVYQISPMRVAEMEHEHSERLSPAFQS